MAAEETMVVDPMVTSDEVASIQIKKSENKVKRKLKQIKKMTSSFKEITELVNMLQRDLMTKDELKNFIQISDFNSEQPTSKWTEILFSWRTKTPNMVPVPLIQEGDTCWVVALSRAQNWLVKLSGNKRAPLDIQTLLNGVPYRHSANSGRGLNRLENAADFMINQGFVNAMKVHHRPKKDFQDFEKFIELLLEKGPVVASYENLPSIESFFGKGVFIPTEEDCQISMFEKFQKHCVLITGYGVEMEEDGKRIEFWEVQDSGGAEWGHGGFLRLGRRKGFIRQVIELEV